MPSPSKATTEKEAITITAANDAIERINDSPKSSPSRPGKRKRGEYGSYTPEDRAKFARLAEEIGVAKASRKISSDCGKKVSETTIRSMRDEYRKKVRINLENKILTEIKELPTKARGRPLMLGEELDENVKKFLKNLRLSGGVINTTIVIAAAHGIVEAENRALLAGNGGHLDIGRDYARSLMRRMNLVKRKGTKTARKLPDDFQDLKQAFLDKIVKCVNDYNIPHELIINFDQTGLKMVPTSEWTLEEKGSKDCSIVGLDDKREITGLVGITLTGQMLPFQLIYKGTTERCHPNFKFPKDWNVTHSENHWSTAETMKEYASKVLIPFIEKTRKEIVKSGRSKAHALAIFDVFKAHQDKDFLALLHKNKIRTVFVPPSTTEELQPCDRTVNGKLKSILKQKFINWYSKQVSKQISKGVPVNKINVDLRISEVKPAHANWLLHTFDVVSKDQDCIIDGFRLAGITDALKC